jgi:hypothetical protein
VIEEIGLNQQTKRKMENNKNERERRRTREKGETKDDKEEDGDILSSCNHKK